MSLLAAVEAFEQPLEAHFNRQRLRSWDDVSSALGNEWWCLDGKKIRRGDRLSRRRRLPAILDNERTILGDLIPSSSWGSSLANLLTKASWDRLRIPLIDAHHSVCELCGRQQSTLDVHEVWEYEFPPEEEWEQREGRSLFGFQKLVGLLGLCKSCHECFHLGLADVRGRLDQALSRLAELNRWSDAIAQEYVDTVFARFRRASEIGWLLELGRIEHPDGGLVVKSPWRPHEDDSRFLMTPSDSGDAPERLTALLDVPWRLAAESEWRPAVSRSAMEET